MYFIIIKHFILTLGVKSIYFNAVQQVYAKLLQIVLIHRREVGCKFILLAGDSVKVPTIINMYIVLVRSPVLGPLSYYTLALDARTKTRKTRFCWALCIQLQEGLSGIIPVASVRTDSQEWIYRPFLKSAVISNDDLGKLTRVMGIRVYIISVLKVLCGQY